jgi:uncharacterized protein YjdB
MNDIYYEDTGDNGDSDTYGGNFYEDWQNSHTLGVDYYENWQTIEGYVAFGVHTTQHITSNRKAYAMWWILARIAGWYGEIPVSAIQVTSENDATSVMTGGTLQLSAEVLPVDAFNPAVNWRVINGTGSASISASGLLRGGLPGEVEVVASAADGSGVADTMSLTIMEPLIPVTGISISTGGGVLRMDAGTTMQCSAAVLPLDASNTAVIWSMNNISGSALVSTDGLVTAINEGTVEVIATASDGSVVADTILLTIIANEVLVTSITVSTAGDVTSMDEGSTLQSSATVLPANATNNSVEWSILNGTGSATISSSGLVTALTAGTVEVVAAAMDQSDVSGSLVLTIVGPGGFPNERNSGSIQLYPNPGSGRFHIESQQFNIKKISVFDNNGREVLRVSPSGLYSKISLDLTGNPPGIYGVLVSDDQQNLYYSKLVLVK